MDALLYIERVERGVNAVDRAEFAHKLLCRLLTYARYAGDAVGAVAHERLDVYQ